MKASVIIPVYNAEKTIRKCVESLVFGSESDIEIILVEDCSKDNSLTVCKNLEHDFEQVKVIVNPHNSGVSYTRNQGLKHACGEYILFVDSDDWVSGYYIQEMISEKNPEIFTVCGYNYIDTISGTNKIYAINGESDCICREKSYIFDLFNAVLLQQLWNKAFRRDIIQDNNICFDTNQSMGEDFQFVLEYLKYADIKKWNVVNRPLYYYVRANQTSLMSRFGWMDTAYELSRLRQMAELSGLTPEMIEMQFHALAKNTKKNYVYHISRAKGKSISSKIEQIEIIMGDGNGLRCYSGELRSIAKENLVDIKANFINFMKRVNGYVERKQREKLILKQKKKISNGKPISIISQNCIGAVFSHDMGWPFLSPTVNLYFNAKDFMQFVLNLEEYLNMELVMEWGEKWPIGHLRDITIQFMHYETCTDAKESWNRRKERIDLNRILVLATDREGFTKDVYKMWNAIKYPKLLFTAQKQFSGKKGVVYYSKYEKEGCVPDLIPDREFYKDDLLIKSVNRI